MGRRGKVDERATHGSLHGNWALETALSHWTLDGLLFRKPVLLVKMIKYRLLDFDNVIRAIIVAGTQRAAPPQLPWVCGSSRVVHGLLLTHLHHLLVEAEAAEAPGRLVTLRAEQAVSLRQINPAIILVQRPISIIIITSRIDLDLLLVLVLLPR